MLTVTEAPQCSVSPKQRNLSHPVYRSLHMEPTSMRRERNEKRGFVTPFMTSWIGKDVVSFPSSLWDEPRSFCSSLVSSWRTWYWDDTLTGNLNRNTCASQHWSCQSLLCSHFSVREHWREHWGGLDCIYMISRWILAESSWASWHSYLLCLIIGQKVHGRVPDLCQRHEWQDP